MKIGDKVKVIDSGNNYSTYTKMFIRMGFNSPNDKKDYDLDWMMDHSDNDTVFTVFNKYKHASKGNLYGIESENGAQFLFGECGLIRIGDKNKHTYYWEVYSSSGKVQAKNLVSATCKAVKAYCKSTPYFEGDCGILDILIKKLTI